MRAMTTRPKVTAQSPQRNNHDNVKVVEVRLAPRREPVSR
jgi:hypothetical protein